MATALQSPRVSSEAEIDVELFTFVERYATNPVRWDVLLFFGLHPDRRVTIHELARLMRRTVRATTKELDDLSYLGVLRRRYTPDKVTYQLNRRGTSRRAVKRLAALAGNGHGK
ncbi:MAG: hypothetical protein ACM3JD_07660 [Rudaea sp.]